MGQADSTSATCNTDDRRNLAWFIDKAVQVLVFIAGISAIVFIIGIFVFITKEGVGFILKSNYALSESVFNLLEDQKMPEDQLDAITVLEGKKFSTAEDLLKAVEGIIGVEAAGPYKEVLIEKSHDQPFHVKSFFTSPKWAPTSEIKPVYGTLALMVGTASVTGLAMLIAIPFSLGAAIYIGEFATGRKREFLKILVELLAAIPSVVWGFVGLSMLNPLIIKLFNVPIGLNVLNAGVILGLMAAPIMTTIAEDALKAVPDRYREAAEAMGATRWQIIFKVVVPAARHGLVAAVLLGVGRGFGETMAVLMATGHSINLPTSIFDSVRAMTATIAAELGEAAVGSDHYRALFTLGILLFLITFMINLSADLILRGVRKE
ncbi:MAG: phosphate ABC transporter permease subunit PstC [Desulfocapsaceae bacterium]|nr:phosphate ABC transporter permease subunit PstC [Desulfocapsaceae bacterium]